MSILIDKFVEREYDVHSEINGKWYIAKPLNISPPLMTRILNAFKVLNNKAVAVHYKVDE